MSRTFKDKPSKLKYDPWDQDMQRVEGFYRFIQLPTTKPKKRKEVDTEWHWMSTPSWWTRLVMNKPKRRACRLWENTRTLDNLDDVCPDYGNKPHIYYW